MPDKKRMSHPSKKQLAEDARPDFGEAQIIALAGLYEEALAAWRDAAGEYAGKLEELLTTMTQIADVAGKLESVRLGLMSHQRMFHAAGHHVDRPSFPTPAARVVADAAARGKKAAVAAMGAEAKTHIPKAAEDAPESG
jgi:single-stranded DNA-specific DHH superfamily exonuclease